MSVFVFAAKVYATIGQFNDEYKNFEILASFVGCATGAPSKDLEGFKRHIVQKLSAKFRMLEFSNRFVR